MLESFKCRACKRKPANPDLGKISPLAQSALDSQNLAPETYYECVAVIEKLAKKHIGLCNSCSISLSVARLDQALEHIANGVPMPDEDEPWSIDNAPW